MGGGRRGSAGSIDGEKGGIIGEQKSMAARQPSRPSVRPSLYLSLDISTLTPAPHTTGEGALSEGVRPPPALYLDPPIPAPVPFLSLSPITVLIQ